jgi:Permuted papain-like amidase enzyme, YaeF/YiiX, C92 family
LYFDRMLALLAAALRHGAVRDGTRARLVARAISLLSRIRSGLLVGLSLYLSKPVRRNGASEVADLQSLAAVLLPGDVLLTDGNTRAAAIVRRATKATWAHVALYVGALEEGEDPRCIVEADFVAGVRAVRLSELEARHVHVLRPTPLNDSDRRRLADWVVSRIGDKYDLAHAWALGTRLLRLPLPARLSPPPSNAAAITRRFICSSLLAQAFLLVGYPIIPTRHCVGSAASGDLRHLTPCDFESASIFEVVNQL